MSTDVQNSENTQTNDNGVSQEEINRLFWHSRRGMLELDVLLVPFTKEVYPTLSPEERACYVDLLACEDADLFVWFMGKEPADEPRFVDMVAKIIDRARSLPPAH